MRKNDVEEVAVLFPWKNLIYQVMEGYLQEQGDITSVFSCIHGTFIVPNQYVFETRIDALVEAQRLLEGELNERIR